MKLKELKHNHSLTDLLKVLIFSILMITPLLSVATRCLYVICNKNAYQSYYGETINDYQIKSVSNLKVGDYYYYASNRYTSLFTNVNNYIYVDGIENFDSDYTDTFNYDEVGIIKFLNNGTNNPYISFQTFNNTVIRNIPLQAYSISFNFEIIQESLVYDDILNFITIREYVDFSYLDNVFEYSVNKLAESPILSWTQQTAIYTGVSTMTTQLGVSTPTIPMLIVYWFLLTVIYIIIDIIIKLFTWLTHMIGSKSV